MIEKAILILVCFIFLILFVDNFMVAYLVYTKVKGKAKKYDNKSKTIHK